MSALGRLTGLLGDEVQTEEDETYALFTQDLPSSQDLGMIDAHANRVDVTLSGRDLAIHQSPGVLSSNRAGGTTGAVVWKITPLLADWLSSPANPLFASGLLSPHSAVLELGCGVSGLVGLALAPRVRRVVLTDQAYVGRLVERNVAENVAAVLPPPTTTAKRKTAKGGTSGRHHRHAAKGRGSSGHDDPEPGAAASAPPDDVNVHFVPLDWETDQITPHLLLAGPGGRGGGGGGGGESQDNHLRPGGFFDAVIACDCVYNDALVGPLVATCADACRLKGDHYYYHMQGASLMAVAHVDGDRQGSSAGHGLPAVSFSVLPGPGSGPGIPAEESSDMRLPDHGSSSSAGGDDDGGGGGGGNGGADESGEAASHATETSTLATDAGAAPCVCVVAQQLRHADVFAAWMARFLEDFRAWRVPEELLPEGLRTSMGFAIHIGVLRTASRR